MSVGKIKRTSLVQVQLDLINLMGEDILKCIKDSDQEVVFNAFEVVRNKKKKKKKKIKKIIFLFCKG